MELTPQQQKKLTRLAKVIDSGNLGVLEYLNELEDIFNSKVEEIKTEFESKLQEAKDSMPDFKNVLEQVKGKDGKDGKDGVDGKDSTVPGPRGDKGDKGKDGKNGKDGRDGKDGESIVGPTGADGKDGKDGSPDTPIQIVEKLESLEGEDRLDKKAIKGLEDIEKDITDLKARPTSTRVVGGARAGGSMIPYDLSAQTNGTLKVFTVPKNRFAFVVGSDFPTILLEGNGFTLNGTRTQLTLTTINAPSQGSQLAFIYTSLFNQ